ncbi:MAG: zinc metallopeptidase [Eubacterium sp.]|nr:zinc metallopeptidase [Eubacterium sp.]
MGYGYYPSYYYGFDWTYLIILAAFIFSLAVQGSMKSTFAKYSRVAGMRGATGFDVASQILASEGLYDVRIERVSGSLTDHYDPRTKTVRLSDSVYGSTSVAALGVAAHECGHAIQDAKGYIPLSVRSALVPVANFGSNASWIIFIIGLIFSIPVLTRAGIILFCAALLFQLVTLPVEFNASHRALLKLESLGIMGREEVNGTRKVLKAAAMTYVAAACASLAQLIRMILISGNNRRRD